MSLLSPVQYRSIPSEAERRRALNKAVKHLTTYGGAYNYYNRCKARGALL
jgi:hypothetical protein